MPSIVFAVSSANLTGIDFSKNLALDILNIHDER